VGDAVKHGGRHFGVAEHLRPISEGQIGGDQQRSVLSVINTATNTVVATVNVGLLPQGIMISPNGALAYVA
jgi:YVTN family beta-propeller protein